MEEIWKDISGYERYYQVSNLGRVRSLNRVVNNPHVGNIKLIGKIKLCPQNSFGYPIVLLHRNGKQSIKKVHRLVAQAFIQNIDNKPYINHIDGDKANNKVDNLEWRTAKENVIHAISKGLTDPTKGKLSGIKHHLNKGVSQYDLNNNLIQSFYSITEAHNETGVSKSGIIFVCKGERKTAGGYKWKYNK